MKYFVRCIKATKRNPNDKNFTVGKVYEVTEKGIVDDTGFKYISYTYGVENNVAALNKWFNSCGYKFELANDDIKRVIFNDPATVILWADGTKTVAKAVKGDKYDPEKGFAIAYAKKFGGKTFREEMEKWCAPIVDEKAKNDPLTIEELKKMDGKRVWLSSIYAGEETFNDGYCGWHTVDVSKCRLIDDYGCGYRISEMDGRMGFRAYLTPQTGKK